MMISLIRYTTLRLKGPEFRPLFQVQYLTSPNLYNNLFFFHFPCVKISLLLCLLQQRALLYVWMDIGVGPVPGRPLWAGQVNEKANGEVRSQGEVITQVTIGQGGQDPTPYTASSHLIIIITSTPTSWQGQWEVSQPQLNPNKCRHKLKSKLVSVILSDMYICSPFPQCEVSKYHSQQVPHEDLFHCLFLSILVTFLI